MTVFYVEVMQVHGVAGMGYGLTQFYTRFLVRLLAIAQRRNLTQGDQRRV